MVKLTENFMKSYIDFLTEVIENNMASVTDTHEIELIELSVHMHDCHFSYKSICDTIANWAGDYDFALTETTCAFLKWSTDARVFLIHLYIAKYNEYIKGAIK